MKHIKKHVEETFWVVVAVRSRRQQKWWAAEETTKYTNVTLYIKPEYRDRCHHWHDTCLEDLAKAKERMSEFFEHHLPSLHGRSLMS